MSFVAAAIVGSGALGAGASIFGSIEQSNAANKAISAQQSMFNTAQQNQQPFIQAGQSVLPSLQKLLTPGPDQTDTLNQLPGFKFIQDWGQKGVTAQATTRGLGGNALTAGANYATGAASTSFNSLVQLLQNFASMGSNSASNVGTNAVTTGQGIASSTIGQGNAIAAGGVGAANSLGNAGQTYALLNALGLTNGQYGLAGQNAAAAGLPVNPATADMFANAF